MSKIVLMTATVQGANGGFDMFQMGESSVWPLDYRATDFEAQWGNASDAIDAYLEESRNNDIDMEETDEIDGKIYNQDDAKIYKYEADGATSYFALRTIDAPTAEVEKGD